MSIFKPTFNNVMEATFRHIDLIHGAETQEELKKITAYSHHIIGAARKVDKWTAALVGSMTYRASIRYSADVLQASLRERFGTQLYKTDKGE